MTEQQLQLFDDLSYYEGVDVEYKAAKGGLPRDLWETYSAFANTDGGTPWLGIAQREGVLDVHGVADAEKLAGDFWNTLNNRSKVNRNLLAGGNVRILPLEDKPGRAPDGASGRCSSAPIRFTALSGTTTKATTVAARTRCGGCSPTSRRSRPTVGY